MADDPSIKRLPASYQVNQNGSPVLIGIPGKTKIREYQVKDLIATPAPNPEIKLLELHGSK